MRTCIEYPVLANHEIKQVATNLEFWDHLTNSCEAEIAVQEVKNTVRCSV